jgi:hypothetical protein
MFIFLYGLTKRVINVSLLYALNKREWDEIIEKIKWMFVLINSCVSFYMLVWLDLSCGNISYSIMVGWLHVWSVLFLFLGIPCCAGSWLLVVIWDCFWQLVPIVPELYPLNRFVHISILHNKWYQSSGCVVRLFGAVLTWMRTWQTLL